MNAVIVGSLRRISKRQARKLWDKGAPFRICPVKLRPGFPFAPDMLIEPMRYTADPSYTFDRVVGDFEFYNANTNETGYYSSFWVEV